ncbi:MAG TPA: HAD-IIIA family hydrolase [Fimbriimonadaceae bacterium]|nr:HAD-IIIA family hydrolase [Fimbriimonadaceae bacterium]
MAERQPLFLDRDGVLNRDMKPYIATADELEIFPWTLDALALLDAAGFEFYIVSNQQGVAKGFISPLELEKQTEKIESALATRNLQIRRFYYCTALAADNHPWRKPGDGMIQAAREEFGIDPAGAFLIGDRWSDIEAGAKAGCRPLLVLSGGTDEGEWMEWKHKPEKVFPTLLEAAQWIAGGGS